MFSVKELTEMREQLRREIQEMDNQIYELEMFYIEDTKEAGNLLKGFDNYISAKTSKMQAGQKKQKVQNVERLFSITSTTSKTSQIVEETLNGDPQARIDIQSSAPKRNRPRQGKTKSGGKNLLREENEEEEEDDSDSGDMDGGDESIDQSLGKGRSGAPKKKRIGKIVARKG